jgi:hypothetical protein
VNYVTSTEKRQLEFGFYPSQLDIRIGPIAVSTLPGLDQKVAAVQSGDIEGDWIYAPRTARLPPHRVFGLPKTHVIVHDNADSDEQMVFSIWVLSFLLGMRLTTTEAGFLDSTPIKPGHLTDFLLMGSNAQGARDALEIADAYWISHRNYPERARLYEAAVHALFLSQHPGHLQFERFILLYAAFDACFALTKSIHPPSQSLSHAGRIEWMCQLFSIPIPEWALRGGTIRAEVVSLRNQCLHEALFVDAPLGFAVHGVGSGKNLTLEMSNLVCRLLVALLGSERSEYVTSPVNTYQQEGLTLIRK